MPLPIDFNLDISLPRLEMNKKIFPAKDYITVMITPFHNKTLVHTVTADERVRDNDQ